MNQFLFYTDVHNCVAFDSCAPTVSIFGASEIDGVTFEHFTDEDAIMLVDCVDYLVVFGVVLYRIVQDGWFNAFATMKE